MDKRFCLGIDLGTSNCVTALSDTEKDALSVIPITQVISPGTIGENDLFPSSLYIPNKNEFAEDSFRLPWGSFDYVTGIFARNHGALVPDRLIASAKSWLSNHHIDRKGAVLPWNSETVTNKLSPFETTRIYLQHIHSSFDMNLHHNNRDITISDCQVIVTVPASFDEVARSLTHEAAAQAGLDDVVLLEEPQAAFYAWIGQNDGSWRKQIKPRDIILVCDLGGGTADFSLIAITDNNGDLELRRVSVGDHILLGGDNMDLALAYTLRARLQAEGKSVDHWQLLSLVHACRQGKEKLLSDDSLQEIPVAATARGSSLFAKALSTTLTREDIEKVLIDGFIPLTAADDFPIEKVSAGLQEHGLSYAADPALSKHLARFLSRSLSNIRSDEALLAVVPQAESADEILIPNAVLFNGGVFKSSLLRQRVVDLLSSWSSSGSVKELPGADYDLAVARGAALYGAIRASKKGLKIHAGTARSYYIGVETTMPAIPSYEPPLNGLCIVPQGMEEGSELCVEGKEFGLVTGRPVEFRFFSSSVRAGDAIGDTIEDAAQSLEELSGLQITLPSVEGYEGEVVPVQIHTAVTETGMLELWMYHTQSDKKWKLEFNVRG
ncbi:MAG: Hsp70 family protein [Bdellovibrionota bacterium]|jgi:molecular chaperone DnaK (HSP70)